MLKSMDKVRALNRLVGSLPHGCVVGNSCENKTSRNIHTNYSENKYYEIRKRKSLAKKYELTYEAGIP